MYIFYSEISRIGMCTFLSGFSCLSQINEKAKIHSHEPKGAKIKGSNIYVLYIGIRCYAKDWMKEREYY